MHIVRNATNGYHPRSEVSFNTRPQYNVNFRLRSRIISWITVVNHDQYQYSIRDHSWFTCDVCIRLFYVRNILPHIALCSFVAQMSNIKLYFMFPRHHRCVWLVGKSAVVDARVVIGPASVYTPVWLVKKEAVGCLRARCDRSEKCLPSCLISHQRSGWVLTCAFWSVKEAATIVVECSKKAARGLRASWSVDLCLRNFYKTLP